MRAADSESESQYCAPCCRDRFDMRERPHLIMDTDGLTPLALTNGAAPNAAWNQRGMWTECNFKTGSDCRGEQTNNLFLHLNQ